MTSITALTWPWGRSGSRADRPADNLREYRQPYGAFQSSPTVWTRSTFIPRDSTVSMLLRRAKETPSLFGHSRTEGGCGIVRTAVCRRSARRYARELRNLFGYPTHYRCRRSSLGQEFPGNIEEIEHLIRPFLSADIEGECSRRLGVIGHHFNGELVFYEVFGNKDMFRSRP